jgi:hypothetical protein
MGNHVAVPRWATAGMSWTRGPWSKTVNAVSSSFESVLSKEEGNIMRCTLRAYPLSFEQ